MRRVVIGLAVLVVLRAVVMVAARWWLYRGAPHGWAIRPGT